MINTTSNKLRGRNKNYTQTLCETKKYKKVLIYIQLL